MRVTKDINLYLTYNTGVNYYGFNILKYVCTMYKLNVTK